MEVNTTLVQCYPAHEALPDGDGPFPAVILIHGAFGLNDEARLAGTRLAREGFYVLAPDFYASPVSYAAVAPDFMRVPTGGGIDYADEDTATMRAEGVSDERAGAILRQAIGYVGTRSHAQAGGVSVVGFSTGGRWALFAACTQPDEVNACVAFYPAGIMARGRTRVSLLDRLDAIRCPVLLFYGALDSVVPAHERDALRAGLARLGGKVDLQVFRGAGHDFFAPDRDSYDISSSRAAWSAMLALLKNGRP
jgi:carboxymethylenebutenolidase